MNGSNTQKIIRLSKYFTKNPADIIPYFTLGALPYQKKTPLELEIPWFSWEAIRFLKKFIKPGMKVFEWGSGGSTLYFANNKCDVYSIEDHAEWYEKVREKTSDKKNISINLIPYDFNNTIDFQESHYLNPKVQFENYDIIVIDGTEKQNKVRPSCFLKAQKEILKNRKLSKMTIIIVDDSWRYPEIIASSSAKKIHRFEGTGPCRLGVTSTDIHVYTNEE